MARAQTVYPAGSLTENTTKRRFHQPLENALADFSRERTFVTGTVVGGEGEEVGGITLEARHRIAGYSADDDRGAWGGVFS